MNDNQSRLMALSNIVSGLLASGHYSNDKHGVDYMDVGPDWKADGYKAKLVPSAVVAGTAILEHIEREIEGLPKEP